jgi:hypothetical protein
VPTPVDVPAVAQVVACFQRTLREGELPAGEGVLQTLLELHRNNIEQWRWEDTTRDEGASDAIVAAAKRAIDAHNATRHRLVEAIDAALADTLEQDASATPATESPGMVFDRLSVLTIRLHVTEERTDRDGFSDRVPLLRDQLATLQRALDGLFDDVRGGRRCFVSYRSLKVYGGGPATGASTADTHPG